LQPLLTSSADDPSGLDFNTIADTPQSTSPLTLAKETYRAKGIRGFYAGCGALVTGNAVKAAVRFTSYDRFKRLLVNQDVGGTMIHFLQMLRLLT